MMILKIRGRMDQIETIKVMFPSISSNSSVTSQGSNEDFVYKMMNQKYAESLIREHHSEIFVGCSLIEVFEVSLILHLVHKTFSGLLPVKQLK